MITLFGLSGPNNIGLNPFRLLAQEEISKILVGKTFAQFEVRVEKDSSFTLVCDK